MRFLRRKYKDPLTGKDDWKPVFFGQAHVRPLGFFGQPLMTVGLAGNGLDVRSCGEHHDRRERRADREPRSVRDGWSEWCRRIVRVWNELEFGSSTQASDRRIRLRIVWLVDSGSTLAHPVELWLVASQRIFDVWFFLVDHHARITDGFAFGSSGSGTSATTFGGGGPIVGFTLPVDKPSLIEYKMQKRYNKWEFNYDPMEDQAMGITGLNGGSPNTTNPSGSMTNPESWEQPSFGERPHEPSGTDQPNAARGPNSAD